MKKYEKLALIRKDHYSEYCTTAQQVRNELSDKQSMFCCCGRLATGLHESSCRKFSNKVENETIKRLSHLVDKK